MGERGGETRGETDEGIMSGDKEGREGVGGVDLQVGRGDKEGEGNLAVR